jgi:hypothetical protein
MKTTSMVTFITNDKLKTFIREVQDEFKDLLEATKEDREYLAMLRTQFIIRQYLVEHQKRIDFSKKGFVLEDKKLRSMPSFFGLYMMVICNVDYIDTIEDVMDQINRRFIRNTEGEEIMGLDASDVVFSENELHEDELCCCSHFCNMRNLSVVKNRVTNYCAVIGSECIHKNNLIDKDVILIEKKKQSNISKKRK